jgi:hypothetical protein
VLDMQWNILTHRQLTEGISCNNSTSVSDTKLPYFVYTHRAFKEDLSFRNKRIGFIFIRRIVGIAFLLSTVVCVGYGAGNTVQ